MRISATVSMQIDDLAHAASLHIHPRPGVTFEADEYDEATLARASDAAQAALNAAALQQLSLPEQSLPSAMHLQSVMKHYGGERVQFFSFLMAAKDISANDHSGGSSGGVQPHAAATKAAA